MAKLASEIMNPELFTVRPTDSTEETIGYFLALGITAAPVLDPYGKLVGYFSIRDALARGPGPISRCMSAPAQSVREDESIERVAELLADGNLHHAAVVGRDGHVVGVVSTVDVLKALLGKPVSHPPAFPHYDRRTGLTWTDDTMLSLEEAPVAPNGPGVLALLSGGAGRREQVVWAETCNNVRTRVYELLSDPQNQLPTLARILDHGAVRFRAASVPEYEKRRGALSDLMSETRRWMLPANAEEIL